jgi:hypothetical protein
MKKTEALPEQAEQAEPKVEVVSRFAGETFAEKAKRTFQRTQKRIRENPEAAARSLYEAMGLNAREQEILMTRMGKKAIDVEGVEVTDDERQLPPAEGKID